MILNSNQAREYNRAMQLQNFLIETKAVYENYVPFNKEAGLFFSNIKLLGGFIPVKGKKGEGVTQEKGDLKTTIANEVNNICSLTLSYAITIGDIDLESAVSNCASLAGKMKDGEVQGLADGLVTMITPLLDDAVFKDYAITKLMLDTLSEDADTFNGSIGKAGIIDSNSSIANKSIDEVFKDIRGNVVQFGLLITFFQKDDAAFTEGYYKNSAISKSGIRHNGVEGVVTSKATSAPIEGATIVGTGKNKVTKSNVKGSYRLIKIKAGNRTIEVSAPGCVSQTIAVKIIRGKVIPLNIAL